MKLSPRAFTIFWSAHAWVGVLSSGVLFILFFLGPFALFWKELGPWQEQLGAPPPVSEQRALEIAQREAETYLAERPTRLGIHLPDEAVPWIEVKSSGPDGDSVTWVDPSSGERIGQQSDLGYFLFSMHFLEPIPGGKWLAGIAAALLLFLSATGLVIQLSKLVRELVQFRPLLRARVFWADAHKVVGILGLPFLIVFAWSGAILCLFSSWLLPVFVVGSFGGDIAAVEQAAGWRWPPSPAGQSAAAPDLSLVLERARAALPGIEHKAFVVYNHGDVNAVVDVRGGRDDRLAYHTNVRTSRDGEVQWVHEPDGGTLHSQVSGSLHGLHFAIWAGPWIKAVYALLALLGAFCILTGNLVWLERRRSRRRGLGDVVLARLTAGACAGLCVAVAALFMANRVLPDHLAVRPRWEHAVFWAAWASAAAYAGLLRSAARSSRQLLRAAGMLMCAVPIVGALQKGRLPFVDWSSAHTIEIEIGLLALGILLLAAGHAVRKVQGRVDHGLGSLASHVSRSHARVRTVAEEAG
jgi:uncharacterized iron-regulated membrane protein